MIRMQGFKNCVGMRHQAPASGVSQAARERIQRNQPGPQAGRKHYKECKVMNMGARRNSVLTAYGHA